MTSKFARPKEKVVLSRLQEKRRFIQILFGPRQVGKTTLVHQALARLKIPVVFASTVSNKMC